MLNGGKLDELLYNAKIALFIWSAGVNAYVCITRENKFSFKNNN